MLTTLFAMCLWTPSPAQTKASAKQKDDNKSLLTAVVAGKAESVKALIAAGADVNVTDSKGMTPLILAVFLDNENCVEVLIAGHADVNAKETHLGNTALMTAAKTGNAGILKALIAARADVNAKDKEGWTALMKTHDAGIIKVLRAAGADVNAKNNIGLTALMYTEDAGSAKVLIAAGADVNAKDNNGATALLGAALAKDAGRVKVLIAAGANVNEKDNTGWAPLMGAANKGCAECIEALIAAGGGMVVNAKDVSGNTALMYAAQSGSPDSVKALIAAGADVNAKNNHGMTALGAANSEAVAAILRSARSKDNSMKAMQAPDAKDHSTQATRAVVVGSSVASDAMADKEWDAIKDNLAPGPFKNFLAKYPQYRGVEDKRLYLSLEEQMAQIRAQKSKPDFSMSFEILPAQWSRWRKNYYYLSVISIGSDGAMGIGGGFSGRFDNNGNYTLPTKSGSIFIFEPKSPNADWSAIGKVLFNGITIQTKGMDKLYFGVMEEYGIVHLRGVGTAKMPDGKVYNLK